VKKIHIKEITRNISLGCTDPMLALTDDGQPAVIKVYHKGQGDKVLFNELFAYQLAHCLCIPTPDFFIGIIDDDTSFRIDFEEHNKGLCFCSSYINHSTTVLPETLKWICSMIKLKHS